ncbi:MAG: tetratricopeptide repeat protein [Prevotella sp.]|jgi:tetratricopeptide (TPR) repeat protein|nr:tetratricopeptide repeat protein [Prevotella sp.]
MTAEEYYKQGNEHRRRGDFPAAMNCYLQAAQLDPEGPGATAEQMLEDIMNFYCKDIYNP